MKYSVSIPTVRGEFTAVFSERGLAELNFPDQRREAGDRCTSKDLPRQIEVWVQQTGRALEEIFRGKPFQEAPPFDLSQGTNFQQSVWRALAKIPTGRTLSYGEVARAIGNPKAVRAVGGACGANPIPVLIPCHRVLAAGKKIGGFGGGLDWKRRLLAAEGVIL
jgi:methylated-DNA-[protein]-cysteine S-methyltransferase